VWAEPGEAEWDELREEGELLEGVELEVEE